MTANVKEAHRPLHAYARDITLDWQARSKGGIGFAAAPYLEAMSTLERITDRYCVDDAVTVVEGFLANCGGWRGPEAKRIKRELSALVEGERISRMHTSKGDWK